MEKSDNNSQTGKESTGKDAKVPDQKFGTSSNDPSKAGKAEVAVQEMPLEPAPPKRILVIDDDPAIRRLFAKMLKNAGYEVTLAADGKEGLQLFHDKPVDLVITDMVMPEKMGIDVILELKQKFPKMKVIAISGGGAFGSEIELDMARTLDAYTIEKPFSPKDILAAVDRLTTEDQTKPVE